jgi:O-antigen ligase
MVVFAAAASGLLVRSAFAQVSGLKYLITVGGVLLVLLLVVKLRPSLIAIALLVLAAPFAPYVVTLHGQAISLLFATVTVALLLISIEGPVVNFGSHYPSALGRATPWILVLLSLPALLSRRPLPELTYLVTPVIIGFLVRRVSLLHPSGSDWVAWAVVASAGLQAAFAVFQRVTGHATNLYSQGTASYSSNYFYSYGSAARTTGAFFDPISLGNFLAIALPFAVLFAIRQQSGPARRVLSGGFVVLITAGLGVSLSRASWIGATVACVAVVLASRGGQRRRALQFVGTLLVLVAALSVTLYGPTIRARFDSIGHPTTANSTGDTNEQRIDVWRSALTVFYDHPLLGVGLGNFTPYLETTLPAIPASGDAQSVYLQYLAEAGVLGGGALCLLIAAAVKDLGARSRLHHLRPALIGSAAAVAVVWATDVTVNYAAVEAGVSILLGLIAAAGSPVRRPLSLQPA